MGRCLHPGRLRVRNSSVKLWCKALACLVCTRKRKENKSWHIRWKAAQMNGSLSTRCWHKHLKNMLYGEKLHPFPPPHCVCMLISQAKHISILNALSKEATINVVLKRSFPPPSAKHCDCGTVPLDDWSTACTNSEDFPRHWLFSSSVSYWAFGHQC